MKMLLSYFARILQNCGRTFVSSFKSSVCLEDLIQTRVTFIEDSSNIVYKVYMGPMMKSENFHFGSRN
uniref:Putative ovule protein n=1 Tax=Solanum chacoense TaxID=4108 RepID=A0A0V0H761_SOLCH